MHTGHTAWEAVASLHYKGKVGRPSTFKLISLLAEVPVRTAVQKIASHTCDIVVSVMLNYGLLARKALRRARPRRYTKETFRNQGSPFLISHPLPNCSLLSANVQAK